jgi:L-iditol 2-dehydrogenase/L-gulonate 5-dehydrogenase
VGEKMKSLVLYKAGDIRFAMSPVPSLKSGEVMIQVAGCGVCGTDMHVYKGMANSWNLPGIIGHEFAGTICDTMGDCGTLSIGNNVTVQPLLSCGKCGFCLSGKTNLCPHISLVGGEISGAMCEYVAVPAKNVIHLPEGLDPKTAVVAEPVATVVHALGRLSRTNFNNVVLFGAGSLGLFILQILSSISERIFVCDISVSRLEKAKKLGASFTVVTSDESNIKEMEQLLGPEKADLVIDAAGVNVVRQQAFKLVRPGGEVLCIALGDVNYPVDFFALVTQQISIYGTQCHTGEDFEKALNYLKDGRVRCDEVVSYLKLENGPHAIETLSHQSEAYIKLVFIP